MGETREGEEKVKGKEGRRGERGGFGPPKNFGVVPPMDECTSVALSLSDGLSQTRCHNE